MIAGVNVIAADSATTRREQIATVRRSRVRALLGRGRTLTDEEADDLLESPEGRHVKSHEPLLRRGNRGRVRDYLDQFAQLAGANELITVHPSPTVEARLRSVELTAAAMGLQSDRRAMPHRG